VRLLLVNAHGTADGGTETGIAELASALIARGVDVSFLNAYPPADLVEGVPATVLHKTHWRTSTTRRLASHLEDAAPPRFAQGVGLAFVVVALGGFLAGADLVGYVATAFALAAALLNATIGLCLGCEAYLLGRRALARLRPTARIPATTGSRSTS